ncbi:MAG: hypothetical protein LBM75_07055 [Myxococcales bacterium]|jgi:hypothetical protein|nr:hypothetical protein [Myxococcales bacterium]
MRPCQLAQIAAFALLAACLGCDPSNPSDPFVTPDDDGSAIIHDRDSSEGNGSEARDDAGSDAGDDAGEGDAGPDATCEPLTNCPDDVVCGAIGDGCGGTIACGACDEDAYERCVEGVCEPCVPETCADRSGCGEFSDGCGGTLDCGCEQDERCVDGVCERCEPSVSCQSAGVTCGEIDDGCGTPLSCGSCTSIGEQCVAGTCQPCVPETTARCAELGLSCGEIDDGCGGTLSCGSCAAPNACVQGACACTPITCAEQGIGCGEAYDGCGSFLSCGQACVSGEATAIRLLSGNLTSGNYQSYDQGHGIRIFQGLTPHVALVQEFKFGGNAEHARRALVEQAFGSRFFHTAEPMLTSGTLPNAIVSYFPIKSSGLIQDDNVGDTRDHVWARIDIPGSRDLWVIGVHLSTTANKRAASAEDLSEEIATLGIPAGDFLVIGGDFNTKKRTDQALVRLSDWVTIDTQSTCPIDQQGNDGTNANRDHPYDALYGNEAIGALQIPVDIPGAASLSARGLVFDSRVFTPLTAVAPVKKNDSGADQMQHMAVIKDFAIPR